VTLVAVVLAAGAGTRFGGGKLSAPFHGEPLVHHAIRAARAAPVERVIVVCSPDLAIGDWRGAPPVEALRVASDALSVSLKAGIAAAREADGAFIFLGDMPLVPHSIAPPLAAALGECFAAVPREGGKNGHPVLLSRRAFSEIAGLSGDEGAGKLLKARSDIAFVDSGTDAIHLDVDRREDLARLERRDDR
jgi:molybdenum cofactor cytidylyltransferase